MRARHDTTVCVEFDPLRRRCIRLAKAGEFRKAAIALAELANREQDAASWVRLGAMLMRAGKGPAAIDALKQGLWLYRRGCEQRKAAVVIALIDRCANDPRRAARPLRVRANAS